LKWAKFSFCVWLQFAGCMIFKPQHRSVALLNYVLLLFFCRQNGEWFLMGEGKFHLSFLSIKFH
jgi:hypothetical protein